MDDFTTIRIRRSTQARLVQVRDDMRGRVSLDGAVVAALDALEPQRNSESKFEVSGREDGAGQAVVDVETGGIA